jgi:hypothetical protein
VLGLLSIKNSTDFLNLLGRKVIAEADALKARSKLLSERALILKQTGSCQRRILATKKTPTRVAFPAPV